MKKGIVGTVLVGLVLRLAVLAGAGDVISQAVNAIAGEGKLVSATLSLELGAPEEQQETAVEAPPEESYVPEAAKPSVKLVAVTPAPAATPAPPDHSEQVLSATLSADSVIKNDTGFEIDTEALAAEGLDLKLEAGKPQILIIHTHGSEAYTQVPGEEYEESDAFRTEDREKNIIAVGDRLTEIFTECGLNVLHDRGIYDYPSYTGSYTRSGEAVESYLADYPSIKIVIDVHRDALGSGDVIYKTEAAIAGKSSSQVMLLVGTGENGLPHPYWKENLKLAMYMQKAMDDNYPTLARPIALKSERYNQHLTQGSMILEVGSSGNTLSEAMCAIELFGQSVGEALAQLVEQ